MLTITEGELLDLIDEFSDGRIQFAFVKVKDPNSSIRSRSSPSVIVSTRLLPQVHVVLPFEPAVY